MTKINVFIENTYKDFPIDEVRIYNDVIEMTKFILNNKEIISKSCLNNLDYKIVSFDIVFVDDEEIHRINKEYRKKDKPTDVITFAIFADSPESEQYILDSEINLGEIIVSLDTIKNQAVENNTEFNDELYYIISHGILHLLGFDHNNKSEYEFMVENQNKIKAVVL